MVGSIDELMVRARTRKVDRAKLRALLQYPWAWPAPGQEAPIRDLLGDTAPPRRYPRLGQVLIATHRGNTVLMALQPWSDPRSAGRSEDTDEALELGWLLGRTHASVLVHPHRALREPEWSLVRIGHPSRSNTRWVDGTSLGLAATLSAASQIHGLPVPPEFCALARVQATGQTLGVGSLAQKVEAIHAWAPAVRVLLVCRDQEVQARRLAEPLGLSAVGVGGVDDALKTVFSDVQIPHQSPEWQPADAAHGIFELVLEGRASLHDWRAVEDTAEQLLTAPLTEEVRHQVHVCKQVARRYEGLDAFIPWPDASFLDGLLEEVRYTVLAHVLRSQEWAPSRRLAAQNLDRVSALIESPPQAGHHLKLMGAAARLASVLGQRERSIRLSEAALQGWLRLRRVGDAAYALSSLAWELAQVGDASALATLDQGPGKEFRRHPDAQANLGTHHWSFGQAWALIPGGAERAMEHLSSRSIGRASTPSHVRASRIRWQVRMGMVPSERLSTTLASLDHLGWAGGIHRALIATDRGESIQAEPATWSRVPLAWRWSWADPAAPSREELVALARSYPY